MQKPRPAQDLRFVLHPESDTTYRHFDGHEQASFAADATVVTRANAWWLAESSLLTYWDPPVAIGRFALAGLTAAFVEEATTQAYVTSDANAVLVCFRGTQPGSLGDIIDDAVIELVPWEHGGHGRVHRGFRDALERVWSKLMKAIDPLVGSRTVWFGGHSLGGALATLAADRYQSTAGVCTLGSPRVGDNVFAAHFNARFGARSLRYVNDTDIVTNVPPPFRLSPQYAHVGDLRHIAADGHVTTDAPSLGQPVTKVFGDAKHVRDTLAGRAPQSLLTHMPSGYVVDIWNDFDAHSDG